MLSEDRELFIRKIGKDVQDEKEVEGRTLMLILVIVGVVLLLVGLILGLLMVNYYLYIILGAGALIILVSTIVYYSHQKIWDKKSFQVIGYYELDRVRKKIRDNEITEDYKFEMLSEREKLIYYTYDLDYLLVKDEYDETIEVEVKIKHKVEIRPKTIHVKTYELTYNDGSKKEISSSDDHFNELIMDFIYKEPAKATDALIRAE